MKNKKFLITGLALISFVPLSKGTISTINEKLQKEDINFNISAIEIDMSTFGYGLTMPWVNYDTLRMNVAGSFVGDASLITDGTYSYSISSYPVFSPEEQTDFVTVERKLDFSNFYTEEEEGVTYFKGKIDIYNKISNSADEEVLDYDSRYLIDTFNININYDNSNYSATYTEDYSFILGNRINDGGDQNYPKIFDFFITTIDNKDVLIFEFYDANEENFDPYDMDSYSLSFSFDLYGLYDDSGIPSESVVSKLIPYDVSFDTGSDLFQQAFYVEDNNVNAEFSGNKIINDQLNFFVTDMGEKNSFPRSFGNFGIGYDVISSIIQVDVNEQTIVDNNNLVVLLPDSTMIFDIYYDQFGSETGYAQYMENLKISFDAKSESGISYNYSVKAEEVENVEEANEKINISKLDYGLYYTREEMDVDNLRYRYYLDLPTQIYDLTDSEYVTYDNFSFFEVSSKGPIYSNEKIVEETTSYDHYTYNFFSDLDMSAHFRLYL